MTAPAPRDPTFRRDIASAYLASASRIGSWVIVSAMVYRLIGAEEFGVLALIRGTLGILNYVTLGIAPALIHHIAAAARPRPVIPVHQQPGPLPLAYEPRLESEISVTTLYENALAIALLAGVVGFCLSLAYAGNFNRLYHVKLFHDEGVVGLFGCGVILRLISDAPGAVIQVRSRIALDNLIVSSGELVWALLVGLALAFRTPNAFTLVGVMYAISGLVPFVWRMKIATRETGAGKLRMQDLSWPAMKLLLSYGSLVVLGQLADYLYAPTDYILIGRLLHPPDLANYAPAVQIDAGLLLAVTGLSAVLLPKTAVAHATGSSQTVRTYYVRGTLASLALLAIASVIIWLISPWIFRLWLGNPMPGTQAILPLVLVNTVLGGSSAVGRSILLAVGKVRPFTIAALTSGAANVACSYVFVRYLNLGLKGIVLGTVVAVIGRCVLWMPWYVLRTIRNAPAVEQLTPAGLAPEPPAM